MNIRAILPLPRCMLAEAFVHVVKALNGAGITWQPTFAVYYHQAMEQAFLQAVDDGVEWILAVDSDSMFTAKHIRAMQAELEEQPDVNALVPVQMRRGGNTPLLAVYSPTEQSGHLGLTFLRTECLKQLEPPWFEAIPGHDGHWGEGKRDADIAFWHKWTRSGLGLHVSEVHIGHCVEKVVGFDAEMRPYCVDMHEWEEKHGGVIEQGVLRWKPKFVDMSETDGV